VKRGLAGATPSQTATIAVEQYRSNYVFLAPDDYDVSYVDVVLPLSATVEFDGTVVTSAIETVGNTSLGVMRIELGPGQAGAHVLKSDHRVGVQVMGYGDYTSYQYPAGLNLKPISPPPIR
jgi:hypothetical protein